MANLVSPKLGAPTEALKRTHEAMFGAPRKARKSGSKGSSGTLTSSAHELAVERQHTSAGSRMVGRRETTKLI
jgi:hypothetical protein